MYIQPQKRFGLAEIISLSVIAFCFLTGAIGCSQKVKAEKSEKAGLVGAWFGEPDLTNFMDADLVKTLEHIWGEKDERGREWSAKWQGFVAAPASEEITFYTETNKGAILEIDGKEIIRVEKGQMEKSGSISMVKGRKYPVIVSYIHKDGGFDSYLKVKWSWAGQDKTSIPPENLWHTEQQQRYWNRQSTDISGALPIDRSAFVTVPVQNVFVYYEPGRFAGWPANNGIWIWGNEILVGFELGYHDADSGGGHAIRRDKPQLNVLARSLDGGETWTVEDPDNFIGDGGEATICPGNINFAHPDFAMRCGEDQLFISCDRGRTWKGPYKFPKLVESRLTSRTDYIVNGPKDCLFFLSAKEERVQAGLQDRAFCATTADGGKTIKFLSWMTHEPITVRSVMPSTVRISKNRLVSAMRRRHDPRRPGHPDAKKNWIDVYQSRDNGKSWEFLSKVASTDTGRRNGNPPSMVRLKDGRLCVTYGYRGAPCGIRAKLSSNNGKTWGEEIHLRDDGRTWDLGYTRTVQRPDGKLVTIYYYTTNEKPEQHIAATIWDPDKVK